MSAVTPGTRRAAIGRWLLPLLVIVALIGLWQAAAKSGFLANVLGIDAFLVPAPTDVASALADNRSLFADNAWVTLKEVLLGMGIAIVVGLGAAVALHLSGLLRRATYPLLIGSQAIPITVIAPILVVWFGFGIGPKLGIVALVCFFSITVNTLDGLRSVDPEAVKMMRTLYASRRQILTRVELPSSLPNIFTGLKIAIAVAVIGAVFGEWAGSNNGLGHQVLQDNAQLETARLFAGVFLLTVMAIALFALVAGAERAVVRWK